MRAFIIFSATLALASAGLVTSPVAIGHGANQFHTQNTLGEYSYGYSGGPSSKAETRTLDGVVRGSYNYIDGHGLVQHASYVADPVNGFRVAATNLPVGPAPVAPIVAAAAPIAAVRTVAPAFAHPIAAPVAAIAPAVHTPVLAAAPIYHASAAPLNNGAVHIANLPVPPAHTPEVVAATLNHLASRG